MGKNSVTKKYTNYSVKFASNEKVIWEIKWLTTGCKVMEIILSKTHFQNTVIGLHPVNAVDFGFNE